MIKRLIPIVVLALAFTGLTGASAPSHFNSAGFAQVKYKSVTLDHTQAGSGDSTNWVKTIVVTDADFKTTGNGGCVASSNGYDLRPYADSAATSALTYYLMRYNGSTGAFMMYVRVPTLSVSSDTVFYLACGDTSLTTDGSSTATWDSNFVAVYPYEDGSTLSFTDISQGGHNGTGTNTPTATTGQVGGAMAVASASTQYMNVSAAIAQTEPITYQAWIKATDLSAYRAIFGTDTAASLEIRADQTAGTISFLKAGVSSLITTTGTISTGSYVFLSVTKSGTAVAVQINGAADETATSSTTFVSGNTRVGDDTNGEKWNGSIDEVQISTTARSRSWRLAYYNDTKSSSTFTSYGSITPISGGSSFVPAIINAPVRGGGRIWWMR